MNPNVEKGLIGAAVLAGLVLLLPVAKQSKEFVNCVKNAETGIINLAGVEFTDVEGKGGFIERPVAVHFCNGGDVAKYLHSLSILAFWQLGMRLLGHCSKTRYPR